MVWRGRFFRSLGPAAIPIILVIAVGILASEAAFGLFDSVVSGALPYNAKARLAYVDALMPGRKPFNLDRQQADDVAQAAASPFEESGYYSLRPPLVPSAAQAAVNVIAVSPGFLPAFPITPMLGTGFAPADFTGATRQPALLSYPLWRKLFGGRSKVVGKAVDLGGEKFLVRGVLPRNFSYLGGGSLLIVPVTAANVGPNDTAVFVARLRAGSSLESVNAWLNAIAAHHEYSVGPVLLDGLRFHARPLLGAILGPVAAWIRALLLTALFVFCLACASAATLLLTRSAVHRRELAIRMALGAPASRLAAAALTESLGLSLLGCAVGLALTPYALEILRNFAIPAVSVASIAHAPMGLTIPLALRALGLGILCAALVGSVPALRALRCSPAGLMAGSDRNSSARAAGRGASLAGGSALIAVQVALAVAFLCVATILAASMAGLVGAKLGFTPNGLAAASLQVEPGPTEIPALLDRLHSVPGVIAVAITGHLPLSSTPEVTTQFGLRDASGTWVSSPRVQCDAVSSGYFRTMGAGLLAGPGFANETQGGRGRVAVVNASLADLLWPGESALGRTVDLSWPSARSELATIVGVAPDIADTMQPGPATEPKIYFLYRQEPWAIAEGSFTVLYRRSAGSSQPAAATIADIIRTTLPRSGIMTTTDVLDDLHAKWILPRVRFYTAAALAGSALLISLLGIFAIVGHDLVRRRRELGVRTALGAPPGRLRAQMIARAGAPACAGAIVGVWAAHLLVGLIGASLYVPDRLGPAGYFVPAALLLAASVGVAVIVTAPVVEESPAVLLQDRTP